MPLILGPAKPAIEEIRRIRAAGPIERITILVAWARITGVAILFDALGTDIANARIAVGMAGAGTSAEALAHLRASCSELHLFHKHLRQTFHPKVYLFEEPGSPPAVARLIVGSSNLTGGGLVTNVEASLSTTLRPATSTSGRVTWESALAAFDEVTTSPFSERIKTDARIQELLEDRYISTEPRLRRRGREDAANAARGGRRRAKPESPPPPLVVPPLPPLGFTFVDPAATTTVVKPGATSVPTALANPTPFVADGTFFVRTLTPNDVAKITGHQVGTFEPDLGLSARSVAPGFWGWPDKFKMTTREEWSARGIAFSSVVPSGVQVEVLQWFRPERPPTATDPRRHAAEHRLRIGPSSVLRAALPAGFNVTSLVVVERIPEGGPVDFNIRIVAKGEPGHEDFSRYATQRRAGHRFGYGPGDAAE